MLIINSRKDYKTVQTRLTFNSNQDMSVSLYHLWPIRAESVPRRPSVRIPDAVGTPKLRAVMKILPSEPPAYNAYSPGSNTTAFNAVGKTIDLRSVPKARLHI